MLLLIFAVLSVVTGPALSAEWHWGRCPSRPPAMKDLDMDKMLGLWYIMEAFDNGEKCMTWNITKESSPNTWRITEDKENGPFYSTGISHAKFNSGTVVQTDKANPGVMLSYWPTSGIAGSTDFTVHDTDYVNYASIFECQNALIFNRRNGLVLSRTPVLRVDLRQMARIRTPAIKVEYYRRVTHSGCKYRFKMRDNSTSSSANYGPRNNLDDEDFGLGEEPDFPITA